jgi:hypothetical protein
MITRDNYEALLDAGELYYDSGAEYALGLWPIVRRGKTRSFVRLPGAFVTPIYFGEGGIHGAGHITELCFWADGRARSMLVPKALTKEEQSHSWAA